MLGRFSAAPYVAIALVVLISSACRGQDQRLKQHKETFESLGATTAAIGEAWLAGSLPGTYTRTALEQTFLLVEQERTALAKSPESLLDPRGAQLSQAAERLSRLLAVLIHDVRTTDGASARQHLREIPIAPPERR